MQDLLYTHTISDESRAPGYAIPNYMRIIKGLDSELSNF